MANNRVIAVGLGSPSVNVRINKKVGRDLPQEQDVSFCLEVFHWKVSQRIRITPGLGPTKIVSSNISHYVVIAKLLPRRASSAYKRPLRSHRPRWCWKHLQTDFFHEPLYYPCFNTAQVRRAQAAKHLQVWSRRSWQCPLQLGTRHLLF